MMLKNKNNEKNPKHIERMSRTRKIIVFVGAVLGAFLLWIYAIGYDSTLFESTYNGIEVTVQGENRLAETRGFTLAEGQSFSSITIVAKGKRSELNALKPSDFQAYVDVSLADKAGSQTLDIIVKAPNGIEIVSQSSTTVEVFVDEFTQHNESLAVVVNSGEYRLGEGVAAIALSVNPAAVTVSGPKSILESIGSAYVDFDMGGQEIRENIRGYGVIKLLDKNGKEITNPYVTLSDSTAEVAITVTKQKSVPVKVAFVGGRFSSDANGENGVSYTKSHDSIIVKGPSEKLVSVEEIVLEVDETKLQPGKTNEIKFTVASELPEGVSSDSVGVITVSVTMPTLSVRTYTVGKDAITVVNLPEGYTYKISDRLKVKVIGQIDAFENFDSSLITAEIDFNDITVNPDGTYSANAKINLGNENSLVYLQNLEYTVVFTVQSNRSIQ